MILNKSTIIYGFVILSTVQRLFASEPISSDTLDTRSHDTPTLHFRSIQLDATYFIFTSGFAGSIDIDMWRRVGGGKSYIGIRTGIEQYRTGGPGGETLGSPFVDYNLLFRSTVGGESFRWDIYLGYMYHTTSNASVYHSRSLLKFGTEVKWMLVPKIFGLLVKASGGGNTGTVGIGFTIGIEQ
jgi:hypothetical protein